MRGLLFTAFSLLLLTTSCDDGDIINVELVFDQELELCGDENSTNYVVYDTKADPFESLTLLFPSNSTNDLIFTPEQSPYENSFGINSTTVRFNYRTYNGDPEELICEDIPSSTVSITNDYESADGTVNFSSTFIDDDNDGIPTENENPDPNNDGNLDDAQDTDLDGIPDYLDEDDDNDNVLTKNEDDNDDGDNNPFTNARNTDGTDAPDYLDSDDDNDGVITRYEDENGNNNPIDDFAVGATMSRFLDATAVDTFVNDNLLDNAFTRTVTVEFILTNIDIQVLSADTIELGKFTWSYTID